MPYIKKEDRKEFDASINALADAIAKKNHDNCSLPCGDLNYSITRLIHRVLDNPQFDIRVGYADYNEMIGMLECAKLELYRRKVAPYEDEKIKENGDV